MNANDNNTFQSELEALNEEIARSLRMAAFHRGDDEFLAHAYDTNADELKAIRDAIDAGDLAEAGRLASGLQAYVRVEIPKRLLDTIMEAAAAAQNRDAQPAQATYAWTITVDHMDGQFCSTGQIGPEYPPLTVDEIKNHPRRKRFRMLDDDGELYVEGFLVDLDGSCTLLEPLDDWGIGSLGCTWIQYTGPGFKGSSPGTDWETIV